MIGWVKGLLFEPTGAVFPSRYSVSESVTRLQRSVRPWYSFSGTLRECAVGSVTPERVRIARRRPFVRNDFRPYFAGQFVEENGQVTLVGSFGLSLGTKVFMSFWLGFCLLWTLVVALAEALQRALDVLPFAGLGMLTFGVALLVFGRWLSREDISWLSDVVYEALGSAT